MNGLLSLFSALGLSTAAGLNAYIPLLTVGLLARYTDLIRLQAPFDMLENPWVLLVIAIIALLDFIGDKVPAVDHFLHIIGIVIHPLAGAILALAASSSGSVDPTLAAICGIIAALLTHATRTAARPVATATTMGTANPVISTLEDIFSLVMSIVAIVLPVVAAVLVIVFGIALLVLIRGLLRRRASIQK